VTGAAIGLIGLASVLVLFALRIPIALAMIGVSAVGLAVHLGPRASYGLVQSGSYEFAANWTLSAVPMFVLMGYVCFHAGMTEGLFAVSKRLLARVPGSLAASSILACSGFAAMTGSSVACAAAMGRIAIPEMIKAGYDRNFACGTVAAGGTIGALIPPSILLIMFGLFAQASILELFIGGVGLGLLTAFAYIVVIIVASLLWPDKVPRRLVASGDVGLGRLLLQMMPLALLIFIVFAGMINGAFTPTEAGAVGAIFASVIALYQRRMTGEVMTRAVIETVITCGRFFIVVIAAHLFTRFISISGAGSWITASVTGLDLGYWPLLLIMTGVYLILGCFLDGLGAMLLTLPIFQPLLGTADIELIWFGVYVAKMIEIGMITPPFGMNVFVIKAVVGNMTTLYGVFRGVTLFLIADLVVVLTIIAFPDIVLYLPSLLK
jgi:tripartite ATP-independent transporter DctM subunit